MLSEQIKRLRKEKKISQRELGLMFNVIKQTVSSWETGNSKPPHDILEAMADFFGEKAKIFTGGECLTSRGKVSERWLCGRGDHSKCSLG